MSENISTEGAGQDIMLEHMNSHDSEFDDELGVPDSLEATINENQTADVETKEDTDNNEFKHGGFTWTIKKRYKDIQYLHNQLKIYRASLNIPFPTKTHKERRNSLKSLVQLKEAKGRKGALPRFPNKPEVLVPYEQLDQRKKLLEEYLTNLLKIKIYKHHPETINFLEISHLSFIADLGVKGKEGPISKRTGSGAKKGCNVCGLLEGMCCIKCYNFCTYLCGKWHTRHLVVKDTFVAYIRPKTSTIQSVILMDYGFGISYGLYITGRSGLQIANLSRHIVIDCWTRRKAREWMKFIQEVSNNEGRDFTQSNPHNSFAPCRLSTPATWFVDGSSYMSSIADALENAKEEIFIADWWLSPEIFMKRPAINSDYWRLDKILERKALEGVKVFVMIYKEVEVALGINSFYSKQRLVEKCPENIKVLRHPDHARVGIFLWAHHEKIVVVDQSIAFLGGIDLCYGRWDNNQHRLVDLGSSHHSSIYIPSGGKCVNTSSKKISNFKKPQHVFLPLAIATNTIVMVTTKTIPVASTANSKTVMSLAIPQLAPEDLLLMPQENMDTVKCNTPNTERKNLFGMAKDTMGKVKQNIKLKRQELIHMVYNPNEESSDEEDVVDSGTLHTLIETGEPMIPDEVDAFSEYSGTAKLWLGKDYTNFIVKDFNDLEKPYRDLVDRSRTPRMPWHDVGVMVQGASARDVARHFIQRWNAIKMEKAKLNPSYPFLLPKSYNDCRSYASFIDLSDVHNTQCQVLRSVSSWSAGFLDSETLEQSIQEAYIDAISKAERYIYIENQFFITLASMEKTAVKNRIGETLFKRIKRAHREGAVFRVFVIMPLLPGFEGEVGGPSGKALRAITHWNYASISRGKDAILNRLFEDGIEDPSEYITFHGLRTHAMLNGTLMTELIYVHSKLLIVDDNTVICGSANINDRSMIASRDSEIAVIIRDQEFEDGRMNDIPFLCGKFAGSLRKQLMSEHLGLLETNDEIDLTDIVQKSFYRDIWCARSNQNTEIYEEVFHCIPTDKVVNFSMLKQYQNEEPLCSSDPQLAQEMVGKIKGHLVNMPLNFLCNEDLKPAAGTVEGIMPTALWT
ncbi:phospholipase D isoform X2 [Megalopta genalis]|uniref:phospholipase D isoform X2 n=1 Tax=Megalopta genalis TaxID=115081 RepID=UPI001442EA7D|nr:phospholipase D2 isoform X2 [Megalopta genalis]